MTDRPISPLRRRRIEDMTVHGFTASTQRGYIAAVKANPGATYGYQISGPFPCEDSHFENCRLKGANDRTGSYIPVGSPTGTAKILALMLDGPPVPNFNECPSPSNGG